MIEVSKAIVLNSIKFKDTSIIVKCYTQKGIKSYLIKGVLSKNTKSKKLKPAYFQHLTLLELIANHNNKGNLNYIKEAQVYYPFHSIPTNIYKNTIGLFLAEVLTNVLKEEEENEQLFQFLETAFIWLDTHDKTANFHLLFLMNLTKYLGFYPSIPNKNDNFFNLQEGRFMVYKPIAPHLKNENFTHFKSVIGINFDTVSRIKFSVRERQELLEVLIQYFTLHLPDFRKPKSLVVLQTIFR